MDHRRVFIPITSVLTSALVSARRLMASAGVCTLPPYPMSSGYFGFAAAPSPSPSPPFFLPSASSASFASLPSLSSSSSSDSLSSRARPFLAAARPPRVGFFFGFSFSFSFSFSLGFSAGSDFTAASAAVEVAVPVPGGVFVVMPSASASCAAFVSFAIAASMSSARLAFSSKPYTCGRTVRNLLTVASCIRIRFARASAACVGSFRRRKMLSTRWCIRRTHVIWIDSGRDASWTLRLNMYTARRICTSESSRRMWCTSSARKEYASGRSAS